MKILVIISIFFILTSDCLAIIDFNGYVNNLTSVQKTPETVTLTNPDFEQKYFSMNLSSCAFFLKYIFFLSESELLINIPGIHSDLYIETNE